VPLIGSCDVVVKSKPQSELNVSPLGRRELDNLTILSQVVGVGDVIGHVKVVRSGDFLVRHNYINYSESPHTSLFYLRFGLGMVSTYLMSCSICPCMTSVYRFRRTLFRTRVASVLPSIFHPESLPTCTGRDSSHPLPGLRF
jgi:hypothetical protein